jgi:hypothetical protein
MNRLCFYVVALACLAVLPRATGLAQETAKSKSGGGIEGELRKLMTENIRSTQTEDLEAMMKTIHSNSPVYESTRQSVSQVFGKGWKLKYELLSLKYLMTDGDYAIGRVRQRTTKTPPEDFRNNEIDMIVVFKQEDRTWKFWNQAILEVKFISP